MAKDQIKKEESTFLLEIEKVENERRDSHIERLIILASEQSKLLQSLLFSSSCFFNK